MNTTYKLLWIDDSDIFYETTEELIKDVVKDNNMLPDIQYYVHYRDFEQKELETFDAVIFNQYDLLIIDYALSSITGDKIIRDLRARNIYTDVVFYSSELQTMRSEMQKTDQLDGVFFADRDDLTGVVDRVIKKNLRREYDIANIRGLIMDNSSEFDYICRITAVAMFDKLDNDKKDKIEQIAREFVDNANQQSSNNFKDLEKKHGKSYVQKAIESVEYVMSNKDRYRLMTIILHEFDDFKNIPEDFADKYNEAVIKPRNKLAHSKLFYGECKKKLHITKTRQVLRCNQDCDHCNSEYSIETCEVLRKKLFEYYQIFQEIDNTASKHFDTVKQPVGV